MVNIQEEIWKDVIGYERKWGKTLDNRASELEWVTHSENLKHSFDVLGRINGRSKSVYQFDLNGNLVDVHQSLRKAGKNTGLNYKTMMYHLNRWSMYKNHFWSYNNQINL